MATKVLEIAPSASWWYVKHTIYSQCICVLEIEKGQDNQAMNLAPGHGYTVIHYSGPLGCMLSVVQFPKADSMATAKEANIAARLCFCDEQSMVCPAPLKPNCDGGVLTCVQ